MMKEFRKPMLRMPRFVLWLALLCLCAELFVLPGTAKADVDTKNWMQYVPDTMQISQINIPGTHDSGCYYIWSSTGRKCAQTQDWTIKEQLEHGIRLFDFRLGKYKKRSIYDLKLCHGSYDCYEDSKHKSKLLLTDALNTIGQFLKDHPTETVIMVLREENDGKYTNDCIKGIIDENYPGTAKADRKYPWLIGYRSNDKVPTLGEVRGKAIAITKKTYNPKSKDKDPYDNDHCYTDYETTYEWYTYKVSDADYVTPKQKRKNLEKLLSEAIPQDYYSKNDTFSEKGKTQYKGDKPTVNAPMMISTNLTQLHKTAFIAHYYGPKKCWERLYYSRSSKDTDYAGLQNLSLYRENMRLGWISFDFPTQYHVNDIITSNYLKTEHYHLQIDASTLPKNVSISDVRAIVKLENGYQLESSSQWVYNSTTNYYTMDYGQYPVNNPIASVEVSAYTRDHNWYLGVLKYRNVKNTDAYVTDIYEVYDMVDHKSPINIDLTVNWCSRVDRGSRPETVSALLANFGNSLTFNVTDVYGDARTVTVSASDISNYKLFDTSEYAHMNITVPLWDVNWGRLTYTGIDLTPGEVYGNYRINSVEKNGYLNEFTINLQYKLDEGQQIVPVDIEWLDGNDYYGLRGSAVKYITEEFDFYSNHHAEDRSGTVFPGAYAKTLLGVEVAEDGETISYTVNDITSYGTVYKHVVPVPKLLNEIEGPGKSYHYKASAGKDFEYDANMYPSEKHYIQSFRKAYLMGTTEFTVTWIGDTPEDRPESGVTIGTPGVYGNTIKLAYNTDNKWYKKGEDCQIYDDNNKEIPYENMDTLSIKTGDGDPIEGYVITTRVTRSTREMGVVPNISFQIIMRKDENVDVKGTVEWRTGGTSDSSRPSPFSYILKQYPSDPTDPESSIIEEAISTSEAGIVWDSMLENFSFKNLSCFPVYAENGALCTYSIEPCEVDGYSAVVDGLNIILTKSITVSGTVDWENGNRPNDAQPIVQLMQNGVVYGVPVNCEKYAYTFKDLPIVDESNQLYEYTIETGLPDEYAGTYTVRLPMESSRNTSTGNITVNAVLVSLPADQVIVVPILLECTPESDQAALETFTFVIEGEGLSGTVRSTVTVDRFDYSGGSFYGNLRLNASQLKRGESEFEVYQMPGNLIYWNYDQHVEQVKFTVQYGLEGKPMVSVDLGGEDRLKFTNVYQPVRGLAHITLNKQIDNLVAGAVDVPEETFSFVLESEDGTVGTASITGAGRAAFPALTFNEAGEYAFSMQETSESYTGDWEYDEEMYSVYVTVTDKGGFLEASVDTEPVITNTYLNKFLDIDVRVQFIDENAKKKPIPGTVNIMLYADGELTEQMKLTAATDWIGSFGDQPTYMLPVSAGRLMLLAATSAPSGPKVIYYSLNADDIPGFKKDVTGSAKAGFTVTYTADLDVPATGDSANLPLFTLLLMLSVGVPMVLLRKRKAR